MHYWIVVSSDYAEALDREMRREWPFAEDRQRPESGDKALVFQPSNTRDALQRGVVISGKHKNRFIGAFTVAELNPDNKALAEEEKFLWPEKDMIHLDLIKEELALLSKYLENSGWTNRVDQWLSIKYKDYEAILSKGMS